MRFVLGGYAQGKLKLVLEGIGERSYRIYDGQLPGDRQRKEAEEEKSLLIINHFHHWVKEGMRQGRDLEQELGAFLCRKEELVIISDELGNGIVPMDAFEREYREKTGRLQILLAKEADEVVRVLCGIGQRIK